LGMDVFDGGAYVELGNFKGWERRLPDQVKISSQTSQRDILQIELSN